MEIKNPTRLNSLVCFWNLKYKANISNYSLIVKKYMLTEIKMKMIFMKLPQLKCELPLIILFKY